jgi:predicted HicB family RNase H-like nuclease
MKHINLRLPDDLHEKVKAAAHQDRRSLNAWIVVQLDHVLNGEGRPASPPP